MHGLNYNHLRYFWAVAHAGGLTRAAERLNLSQSALSMQLRTLEQRLGHALFERVGRKLVLTEAGRIALDYADTVFAAGDELLSTLQGQPVARRQGLRVGALTTLPAAFAAKFREQCPVAQRAGALRDMEGFAPRPEEMEQVNPISTRP